MPVNIVSAFKFASQILHVEINNSTKYFLKKKINSILDQGVNQNDEIFFIIPFLFLFFCSSSIYCTLFKIIKTIIFETLKIILINNSRILINDSIPRDDSMSSIVSLSYFNSQNQQNNEEKLSSTPVHIENEIEINLDNSPMDVFLSISKISHIMEIMA